MRVDSAVPNTPTQPRRPGSTLITGGAGFIGSHLADALLARGDQVIALDNLSTGRLANLAAAAENPRFQFVHGSILDELLVDELTHRCETVVHLAAVVGVRLIVDQPLKALTTNIRGSEIVIEAAHRYRSKIMIASTSEVYGKNSTGPLSEDADRILGSPAVVRWAYGTAKAVDEMLANAYHRERSLPTVVVRLFNVVGPRQSSAYGMVVPRMVEQALRGEAMTVYGDGSQTRCFAHVADVVRALLGLLDSEAAVGATLNVGAPEEISMLDLAHRIRHLTRGTSPLRMVPFDEAYGPGFEDMLRRVPDTRRIRALTGWRPHYSLDDTLRDTIVNARREMAQLGGTELAGVPTP